jgi:hypothetical protein
LPAGQIQCTVEYDWKLVATTAGIEGTLNLEKALCEIESGRCSFETTSEEKLPVGL